MNNRWVIDTHWLLDLWVFEDPRAAPLRHAIEHGQVRWLYCERMQAEWLRVLQYPAIAPHAARCPQATQVFAQWGHARPTPTRTVVRCRDADDQVFLDLGLQEQACVLSKDKAVLKTRRAMAKWGVTVTPQWSLA